MEEDKYIKDLRESGMSMDDYIAYLRNKWRPGGEADLAQRAKYREGAA
jgi:hypothetical protein